jgi:prevent-host-death family protein
MKTTSVRELRNNYAKVLRWVSAGEEVAVTRRGKVVAKVVAPSGTAAAPVDWSQSAALNRPAASGKLTARQSAALIAASQGF